MFLARTYFLYICKLLYKYTKCARLVERYGVDMSLLPVLFGPRGCRDSCRPRCPGDVETASGSELVGVGFRITKKGDHWINYFTAAITSQLGDIVPDGQVSHVEILVEDKGKVLSFSIVKATVRVVDGKTTIDKGKVHCKVINGPQDHYVYYFSEVNASDKVNLLSFLRSQVGAEFNERGYMLNFFLPGFLTLGPRCRRDVVKNMFSVGAGSDRAESDGQYKENLTWFCSSLVSCGLVLSGVLKGPNFSKFNPNSLFRAMRKKCRGRPPGLTFPKNFNINALRV